MLFVLFPLSIVLNAIRPRIYTMSIDVIIFKVSSVYATIRTIQYSVAALFPVHELAKVAGHIWEGFLTFTMRLLVEPLSLVVSSIGVLADTVTIQ